MAGIIEPYAQGLQTLFGGGTIAGKRGSPRLITGPQVVGGQALPWFTVKQETRNGVQGSYMAKTGFHRFTRPEQGAVEFYQAGPGEEVTSAAPGIADILRQLRAGFLPTVRAEGASRGVMDSSGFAPGSFAASAGGGSRTSPALLVAGAGAALVLLLVLLRR